MDIAPDLWKAADDFRFLLNRGYPRDASLERAPHELESRFGICHATLQIEHGDAGPCKLEEHHVV